MSDPHVPDLERYLARIDHTGPCATTLECLNALIAAHTRSIPFENLDVILGRPVSVEPADIERKLVGERRGGYCFEQNGLFLDVLRALGFVAAPISARVRIQRSRQETPARTHMFLRVELDGRSWLVDVGVGGLSLTSALRLEIGVEQPTPHEPRRLLREGGVLFHQARLKGEWSDVCEFTLEEMPFIDRVVANWYTSAHPRSHFRQHLMAARAAPGGERVTLLDRELTHRDADGNAHTRPLRSSDEVVAALEQEFGITLPAGATLP
jgi:N-hydroxyarylamine O-acetyltransferase